MDGTGSVPAAAIAFVGTHFLLSHPLRKPIVGAVGEGPFLGIYVLVAAATLGWLVVAYLSAPLTPPLWPVGDGIWAVVTAVMLLAAILLMGSLIRNPAVPDPAGKISIPDTARGVYAITRHPMMWAFALWGICHIVIYPVAANIVVAVAIIILALVGAALQDRKKEQLKPEAWAAWKTRTSYWPFVAIAGGRALLVVSACMPWQVAPLSGLPRPGHTFRYRAGRRAFGDGSSSGNSYGAMDRATA